MTLMTQRTGQGPTRRCDARCYQAKHSNCTCICGGKNHGAGIQQALENVNEMFGPLAELVTEGAKKEHARAVSPLRAN